MGAQGDETLFRWNHSNPDINENLKSSTSVIGSLLTVFGDANLRFCNAKHLKCSLKRVKTAGVDKKELIEIISDEMWKPDINKRILKWPQPAHCFSKGQVPQLPDQNCKIAFAFHHFDSISPGQVFLSTCETFFIAATPMFCQF